MGYTAIVGNGSLSLVLLSSTKDGVLKIQLQCIHKPEALREPKPPPLQLTSIYSERTNIIFCIFSFFFALNVGNKEQSDETLSKLCSSVLDHLFIIGFESSFILVSF